MALLTTLNRIEYTALAGETSFAYPFKIFLTSDLEVYIDGLLQGSGYTVTGVGNDAGGNVVFGTAPGAGKKVLILRVEPATQGTVLPSSGPLPAKSIESMADKLTMLIQQLVEVDKRTLKLIVSSAYQNLSVPDPVSGNFLRWKAALDGLENAIPVASGSLMVPVAIVDGGTGATTISGANANLSSKAALTAAATLAVTAERYQEVSGSTTITAFGTQPAGTVIVLRFAGTPLLTHHATDLVLLGGVNYQTVAGDILMFVSEGGGDWRELARRLEGGSLFLYSTTGVNYERLELVPGTTMWLRTGQAGAGVARALNIGTTGSASLGLVTNNLTRWFVDTDGGLKAGLDNTYDIGAAGALRPRDIHAARDIVLAGQSIGQVLDRVAADTTVVNTTTETTIYSKSINANTLGSTRRLRLRLEGKVSTNLSGHVLTFRLKYGATTLVTLATAGLANGLSAAPLPSEFRLSGDTATNAQLGVIELHYPTNNTSDISNRALRGVSAEDSTLAKTLTVTVQWSAADAGSSFTMEHAVLELL